MLISRQGKLGPASNIRHVQLMNKTIQKAGPGPSSSVCQVSVDLSAFRPSQTELAAIVSRRWKQYPGDHYEALRQSVQAGDLEVVSLLVDQGFSADARVGESTSKYHAENSLPKIAVLSGHQQIAQLLLERGANVDAKDIDGSPLLTIAALKGCHELVRDLLKRGANVNAVDGQGMTPLSRLCALPKGKPRKPEDARRENQMREILVQGGADVNQKNNSGDTVLLSSVKYYIAHCDSIDAPGDEGQWHAPALEIMTEEHWDMWKLLLDGGADVTCRDKRGNSSLDLVIRKLTKTKCRSRLYMQSLFELMIDQGANPGGTNDIANQALITAVIWRSVPICTLLLNRGASIDTKASDRKPVLMWAVSSMWFAEGRESVCTLLLNRGASVDAKDDKDQTALMLTASRGRASECAALLDRGADINAQDKTGYTPLMFAVRQLVQRHQAWRYSHRGGPRPRGVFISEFRHEPYDRSLVKNAKRTVSYLLERKARVDLRSGQDQTAYDIALEVGDFMHSPFPSILWRLSTAASSSAKLRQSFHRGGASN